MTCWRWLWHAMMGHDAKSHFRKPSQKHCDPKCTVVTMAPWSKCLYDGHSAFLCVLPQRSQYPCACIAAEALWQALWPLLRCGHSVFLCVSQQRPQCLCACHSAFVPASQQRLAFVPASPQRHKGTVIFAVMQAQRHCIAAKVVAKALSSQKRHCDKGAMMTDQTCWHWLWRDMMCQDAFMCDAVWCSVVQCDDFFLGTFWGRFLGWGGGGVGDSKL